MLAKWFRSNFRTKFYENSKMPKQEPDLWLGRMLLEKAVSEEKSISQMKRAGEVHLIVAVLIATVTFAAGFTLPGGYNDDDGNSNKESCSQSLHCHRYHSHGALPIYCIGLFFSGIAWEKGYGLKAFTRGLFTHHYCHGSNGGCVHDRLVCCDTTFLGVSNCHLCYRLLLFHLLLFFI